LWQHQVWLLLSCAAGNWDVIGEQLRQHTDPQQTLLHASTANSRCASVLLLLLLSLRVCGQYAAFVPGYAAAAFWL
jgi:hypothetical protein